MTYFIRTSTLKKREAALVTKEDIYYKIGTDFLTDFSARCGQEFEEKLKNIISEIFNPDITFAPTDDKEACKNCDFAPLCGRA